MASATTLQSELEAKVLASLPAERHATIQKEHAYFAAMAAPDVAKVGQDFPDSASLLDVHGQPTTLTAKRAGRAAVIVFYRGVWCGYCNVTLHAYEQRVLPALKEKGITLIALSPEKPDNALSAQEKNQLTYTVLSDVGNELAKQLGIVTIHTPEFIEALKGWNKDVHTANADGTAYIPMPATFIVDKSGKIQYVDVQANYSHRTEPQAILDAVANL